MIVVDANIIAALYLENPHAKEADALLAIETRWFAPRLWRSEFRNVLMQYIRHRYITLNEALKIMEAAEEFIKVIEVEPPSSQILRLAHSSGCSAYDCEYVALARDMGTVLITFDRKLLASLPTIALTPTAFLASTG